MDVARALGRAVVEKRLAACANAWPGVESIYRWNGAVETAHECALIVKTTSDRVEAARAELAALHPYETPCLLDFAICGGNAAYLRWIEGQIA
jgi:periplasmic divalent cation tolerance protein